MIIPPEMLPMWAYHASPAISSSKLTVFRQRPMLYKRMFIDQAVTKNRTDALDEGAAFDCALFDGDEKFAADFICKPETYTDDKGTVKPWHGASNTCKAWIRDQELAGKIILERDAMIRFQAMRDAIKNSDVAQALLSKGRPQMSIRRHSEKYDLDVQVRPDWLSMDSIDRPDLGLVSNGRPYIVELKTTEDFNDWFSFLDPEDRRCGSPIWKHGYFRQAGMAQWVAYQDIGKTAHYLLVVEKREPFAVGVVIMDDDYLDMGWQEVELDLKRLRACMTADKWPNNPPAPVRIGPPSWLLDKATREIVHATLD